MTRFPHRRGDSNSAVIQDNHKFLVTYRMPAHCLHRVPSCARENLVRFVGKLTLSLKKQPAPPPTGYNQS